MQRADGDKILLATFQLERDAHAWWESVEATRADAQFTWNKFKEHFNSKYFSERVQERKASKFASLKKRNLTVAEYEAQFSRLARYANHLVSTERMKAKCFLNGLRPAYITQLAPLDIQTYPEMVKKAQLLEDATDLTDGINGRMVKKEQIFGAPSKPTNDKKRTLLEFWEMKGKAEERRSKEKEAWNKGDSSRSSSSTLGFLTPRKGESDGDYHTHEEGNEDDVVMYHCVAFSLNAPRHPSHLENAAGYVVSVQEFGVSLERDRRRCRDEIVTGCVSGLGDQGLLRRP
ncbi:hypothetical protein Taro_032240 [Colocasia esculenta]|uniref:Retrotransposon gag domain-containing protein n=1 Tax=Colocasia esculenta TaxID=4460 RepID=A0A843VYP7_COLES|nr:hypothetical protein [Colocasia esculenta]